MDNFRFAFMPAFLLIFPALLIGWYGWWQQRHRVPAALRYSDTRLLHNIPVGMRLRIRRIPDILRLLAWISLLLAVAQPQTADGMQITSGNGIDIVIALDISSSMAEIDMGDMSRFESAKKVIQDFVQARSGDRFGLIVFAEQAYYQSPLTLDHNAFSYLLQTVPLADEIGIRNRTAIGLGIASGANLLRNSSGQSRVLVLTTDGANNAGSIDPITAAQAAAAFGIRIYTIGLGSEQSSPENRPDSETLQQIANLTGGSYFATSTSTNLSAIYDEINRLETSPASTSMNVRWVDQRSIPLLTALLLLILERFLRNTIFQTIP